MLSPRTHVALWFALGGSACASAWEPQAMAFRQPAAAVAALVPSRPRFVYEPAAAGGKLHASEIRAQLTDTRKLEVSSPLPALARAGASRLAVELHPSTEARATERLRALASGEGPTLRVVGHVSELEVLENDDKDLHIITASLDWTLLDASGQVLHAARTRGGYEIEGPPHDRAELDELHVGTVLGALDHFLAKPEVIARVNLELAHRPAAPPQQP